MKKFTTEEIRDLLNRVMMEEISFSEMVEIMNERVSEAEKKCIEDISTYKRGDFLVKEYKDGAHYIFILDYINDDGLIYYHCYHSDKYNSTYVEDDFGIGSVRDAYHKCLRYATDREKELLLAELSIVGKRWNEKKKRIEEWLEPYEELEKGDLAIFWGYDKGAAMIGEYDFLIRGVPYPHRDKMGNVWANAIKFESKEQYERLIKGEI